MRIFCRIRFAVFLAAFGHCVLLTVAAPALAEKRVALIVGLSAYKSWPALANAHNDARLMAGTLRGLGFTLIGGSAQLDRDKSGLEKLIQSFSSEIENADVALFYYAGHGVQAHGANYLVPIAANPKRDIDVDIELIDVNVVLRRMENAGTKFNIMILDACRNNPLARTRGGGKGLAQMLVPQGTVISYATQPGNVASDGDDGNSPYTKALAQNMRKSGLDVIQMFNEVGLAVMQATKNVQVPWVAASPIKGRFYFAGEQQVAVVAPPTRPPAPPSQVQPTVGVFDQTRKASPLTAAEERVIKTKDGFMECDGCPEMVVVPAGAFVMGSPESESGRKSDEGPQHKVTFAKSFAVGRYAVTFDEWDACVADNGCNGYRPEDGGWRRGKRPVINISWNDAKTYVAWLSRKTGKNYRLLSEAEREYVTRAGTATPFSWGPFVTLDLANYNGNYAYNDSRKGEYRQMTLPVDSFQPNAWGLYQVHGNVYDWVEDCYHGTYSGAPTNGSAWTSGDCSSRVARGGAWNVEPKYLRSAVRIRNTASDRDLNLGFRIARTLSP